MMKFRTAVDPLYRPYSADLSLVALAAMLHVHTYLQLPLFNCVTGG